MKRRTKKLLGLGGAALAVLAVCAVLWVRRFQRYTPAEAMLDLRAAAAARDAARPVERFLEVRYGPLTDPANRRKAFVDFFNLGHIEGLYLIVRRIPAERKQERITAMAQWIAEYRQTMSAEEKAALRAYFQSEEGRTRVREATAAYLGKDVRFRAATAGVIRELMNTLTTVQEP